MSISVEWDEETGAIVPAGTAKPKSVADPEPSPEPSPPPSPEPSPDRPPAPLLKSDSKPDPAPAPRPDPQPLPPLDPDAPVRRIWLCADDYGISPAVNDAIRKLLVRRRINATSVMVAAPSFHRSEAAPLKILNAGTTPAAIGLHLTLTGPFQPMSARFRPLEAGSFLAKEQMLLRGLQRRLNRQALETEIAAQLQAFITAFGRAPDFVDGHQHVHLFPQVRVALLAVMQEMAPNAWVRQCGSVAPLRRRLRDRKALLLDVLSATFRRSARRRGIATNSAFAGTYDFAGGVVPDFDVLFPTFLERLPDGSVVMCHPGHVDSELERLDPLTTQREREYAYFASDQFPTVLRAHGVALA